MSLGAALIGGGPANTGVLLRAAVTKRLSWLTTRGILWVEMKRNVGRGTIGDFAINSDTTASTYLECVEQESDLAPMLDHSQAASELRKNPRGHPPLSLVGDFQTSLGKAVQCLIGHHSNTRCLLQTQVTSLCLRQDSSVEVTALSAGGSRLVPLVFRCRAVVLALGGRQDLKSALQQTLAPGISLYAFPRHKFLLSDVALTARGATRLEARLRREKSPRIVIIGGSHSAFSVAWVLSNLRAAANLGEASIKILHRSRVRVFYPSPAEAISDGYVDFGGEDLCPITQRVHRFGGLRGDGRELWRSITKRGSRVERRVRLLPLADLAADEIRQLLKEATVIVPAFGYRPRTIPIADPNGHRLPLLADYGGPLANAHGRILLADGTPLQQIFGTGMASGFRPSPKLGGEPSFTGQTNGVWLYQHNIADIILDGLAEVME